MKQRRVGNWMMMVAGLLLFAGFAMTVWGVSKGIGGFADFLKGEVTSDMIKVQMGHITEGLAQAFYWTLFTAPLGVPLFIAGFIVRLCAPKNIPPPLRQEHA